MMHSTQSDLEFLYRRLDEVRMSDLERLRARAQVERAHAVAELFASAVSAIKRLFRRPAARPAVGRGAASAH